MERGATVQTADLKELKIERELAKFTKDMTGKGPAHIKVKLNENILVCYVHGFMTKAEEAVVQAGYPEKVCEQRNICVKQSIREIKSLCKNILNRGILSIFPSCLPEKNELCLTIFLD